MSPVRVTITEDRLAAYMELEPPAGEPELREAIEAAGVTHGILEEQIVDAVRRLRGGAPVRRMEIARGRPAKPGQPSRFELRLALGQSAGLLDEESKKIDYHERGAVCNVEAEQHLGYRIRAQPGRPGMRVDGVELPPPELDDSMALVGDGIDTIEEEDGRTRLIAQKEGVLRRKSTGELVVTDVLEIAGDVDLELGNIDVNGSVVIHGSVRSGFRVTARRDIRVDATIEDAYVEAGGSVEVRGGILGGPEGRVVAGKHVKATFGQNATIRCGGNVILEDDVRSDIEAGGDILAREGAGHLRGGKYWAAGALVAKELGSDRGVETLVVVGRDPALVHELSRVRRELRSLRQKMEEMSSDRREGAQQIGSAIDPKQVQEVREAMRLLQQLSENEDELATHEAELTEELDRYEPPTVKVEGEVHQGVEIRIRRARRILTQSRAGGVFSLDRYSETVVG